MQYNAEAGIREDSRHTGALQSIRKGRTGFRGSTPARTGGVTPARARGRVCLLAVVVLVAPGAPGAPDRLRVVIMPGEGRSGHRVPSRNRASCEVTYN